MDDDRSLVTAGAQLLCRMRTRRAGRDDLLLAGVFAAISAGAFASGAGALAVAIAAVFAATAAIIAVRGWRHYRVMSLTAYRSALVWSAAEHRDQALRALAATLRAEQAEFDRLRQLSLDSETLRALDDVLTARWQLATVRDRIRDRTAALATAEAQRHQAPPASPSPADLPPPGRSLADRIDAARRLDEELATLIALLEASSDDPTADRCIGAARALRELLRKTPSHLVYEGRAPSSSLGDDPQGLRSVVREAEEGAAAGRVVESATAAASLRETARWAPYASTAASITPDVLALFDPVIAGAARSAPDDELAPPPDTSKPI